MSRLKLRDADMASQDFQEPYLAVTVTGNQNVILLPHQANGPGTVCATVLSHNCLNSATPINTILDPIMRTAAQTSSEKSDDTSHQAHHTMLYLASELMPAQPVSTPRPRQFQVDFSCPSPEYHGKYHRLCRRKFIMKCIKRSLKHCYISLLQNNSKPSLPHSITSSNQPHPLHQAKHNEVRSFPGRPPRGLRSCRSAVPVCRPARQPAGKQRSSSSQPPCR